MYYVYIDGELAFDHLSDDSVVSSASISQKANAAAYLDMSLVPSASPGEGQTVEVRWDDEAIFHGRVTDASQGVDGAWDVSCVSDEDRLNGVLVPPHSSDGSVGERCPATVSGYVQWLAETFNRRCVGGWRVDVGANEGDLLTQGGSLSVSDSSWPTVAAALDDRVLSLGGWLDWEPREGGGTLSVYADVREASGQLVDLGENVADIKVTRTTDGQRTALVAHSGDLTLDGLSDDELALVSNAGFVVENGAIYDPEAVALYGYSESREELQASTRPDLVRAAIARLRTLRAPRVTVEARAVDTSVYREGASHLRPGQAVRARALPLGLDEYLAVQSVDLDLMDPGQTRYTLGVSYDTLTGSQSARLRELNLGIDHSLDLASGAGEAASAAQSAAEAAQGAADAAMGEASDASASASMAQTTADAARDEAQAAQSAAEEAAKVATNYLGFDSSGLVVGDMTAGELGKNVLIDADSVDVRDGSEVLASFGASGMSIYQSNGDKLANFSGNGLSLVNGGFTIDVFDTGADLNSGSLGLSSLRAIVLHAGGVGTNGGVHFEGSYVSHDGNSLVESASASEGSVVMVHCGSIVSTFSGSLATLMNASQVRSIIGRGFRQSTDAVFAMNGDYDASGALGFTAAYRPSDGAIIVAAHRPAGAGNTIFSGPARVNYMLIAEVE